MTATYDDIVARYDPSIGLETHVELGTLSKMFCGCATEFGAPPNSQVCPVCLGLPGSLPVVNEAAIRFTIMIGLALNCEIATWCRFARKNYFYPDMPKDYQISQYDEPLCINGYVDLDVNGVSQRVEIERVHLEEDTGKSLHVGGSTGRIHGATHSLVDYNRAGIPLVEVVTKVVPGTGALAPEVGRAYVTELRDILRTLGVSDVKMEQGSMRCDVNVSLAPAGSGSLGTRSETKNVNSLRSVERAIRSEILRQGALLDEGGRVVQETRHFHEDTGNSTSGRSKEQAEDYRYFPEPDLTPVAPAREWVESLRAELPELPRQVRQRFVAEHGFSDREMVAMAAAGVTALVAETVAAGAPAADAKNWWTGDLLFRANADGVDPAELLVTPAHVARVVELIAVGALTATLAKQVFAVVLDTGEDVDTVIEARGLKAVGDTDTLGKAVDEAIAANPDVVEKIRAGKLAAVGALVGQVMKATRGQANAATVNELILARLDVEGS
ncbi:MAG: Asp-tRNA(Asn)/Glu-tRNA(Gln) amidotransferase subunit GatB [Actinomycetota bacterium]